MALKDWKQRPNFHNIWSYEKINNKNIFIFIDKDSFMQLWYLCKSNKRISKGFKTKSQVISFGKKYMRKH